MCGIAGFFDLRGPIAPETATARAKRMAQAVAHRGPDDSGVWVDGAAGIAFGHRRLSIIELSELGAQPMVSANGRYVISYNGEVYNFRELRTELEALGHRFRGGSDTEVMLAACTQWGPDQAVPRFVGMFAFALWDRTERTLRLVRDRLGVKPLFWSLRNGVLSFGSELKALMAEPNDRHEVDREALAAFVRHGFVPGPTTIFRTVRKLEPGSILTISAGTEPQLRSYWTLREVVERKAAQISEQEAIESLDTLLRGAVRERMIADVPLGAFLSGGVDSSTVVALMQAQSNRQVRTFAIGFHDIDYDEARHARSVARHLGTDHSEMYVSAGDALEVVPHLAEWFDEPFADVSQIPTYLVARMTRAHVTVALSGDGGDELFAGYPRYRITDLLWRTTGFIPPTVRRSVGSMLNRVPSGVLDRMACIAPGGLRRVNFGEKVHRLASAIGRRNGDAIYADLAAVSAEAAALVPEATGEFYLKPLAGPPTDSLDFVARMQYQDTLTYLPDDILQKVDRCSMAVALEARGPMLDHRLIEFVWSVPTRFKLRGSVSKYLLRRLLYRYIPRDIIERPKMGFSVPLGAWLRGPLRDWAAELLSGPRLSAEGVFAAAEVQRLWQEHLSGRTNHENVLWNLLMFQAWQARYRVL